MSLVAVGLVLGQLAGTLVVGDRSEVRLRNAIGVPGHDYAEDAETDPSIVLSLHGTRTTFTLGYMARLAEVDLELGSGAQFAISQYGAATVAWHNRRLTLTVSQAGSIGRESFVGLTGPAAIGVPPAPTSTGTPPPTVTPPTGTPGQPTPTPVPAAGVTYVPRAQILYIGTLRSSVGATYAFTRTTYGSALLTYETGGGLDDTSRRAYPFYDGYTGNLSLGHALTHVDSVFARLSSAFTQVETTGGQFFTGDASVGWGHNFSPRSRGSIALGVEYLRSRDRETVAYTNDVFATGTATLVQTTPLRPGSQLDLRASASLGTGYNQLLGVVQEQATVSSGATYTAGRARLTAQVDGAVSLPPSAPDATRAVAGALTFGYSLADPIDVTLGARAVTQVFPASAAAAAAGTQWVIFAGLILRAPPILF